MKNSLLFLLNLLIVNSTLFAQQQTQPNIIIVYVDDMGLGDASFTSGIIRPTPNIDRLAKEGKVFTNYYTNSPVCSPSRVALTTGMYPLRWNINTFLSGKQHNDLCDQAGYLADKAPSMARALKSAGYKTAHFGKWHMGGGRNIQAPPIPNYGFDEYVSTWESPDPDPLLTSSNWIWAPTDSIKRWERTSYFIDKTLDFLKRNYGAPCFINLWPDDVHSPWVASEEAQEVKEQYFTLSNLEPVITNFDRDIGKLIKGLEQLGIAKNTLIIFTSDNGPAPPFDQKRTNQLRGCKNSLYEGGVKMPFFAWWPSVIAPSQFDQKSIIAAMDLFPTLCKIGGALLPGNYALDGEDFSSALLSKNNYQRKADIMWEYGRYNAAQSTPKEPENISLPLAIRHDNWKFYCSFDGAKTELYNLSIDPNETTNIANTNADLVAQLKTTALNWFAKSDKSAVK